MAKTQSAISDAFSRAVKRHRELKQLSRAALAKKSGLHQTYVGLLERAERSPTLDTAKSIANALGLSLAEMVGEAEKMTRRHQIAAKKKRQLTLRPKL